jgi:8-oxo-dGTP pyrophosphatase MutT (NUDIX family)
VILLRPGPDRFDVFLVKRNRRVGFMPTAWVFPGGRVDDADAVADARRLVGGRRALERMGLSAEVGRRFLVAAVRETLEESGVWLGDGTAPDAARDALNAGRATLAQVVAEHGLVADLDRLHPWSWWVTPRAEPRRYDTRFFVAVVGDDVAVHDDGETVASAWLPIDRAVDQAEAGQLPMAPPTWWTLRELQACADLDAVAGSLRSQRPIEPILKAGTDGMSLLLPGHASHPEPAIPGLPSEVRFVQGKWWADLPKT